MAATDYMMIPSDDLSENDDLDHNTSQELPSPTGRRPQQGRASALRRRSISAACERCRRRKIRCSGVPGPCTTCTKFGVACVDPGKRRARSQSMLEDRIRRLEALAAAGAPIDLAMINAATTSDDTDIYNVKQLQKLHIQTSDLGISDANIAADLRSPSVWSQPQSPACYSDLGPDMEAFWISSNHDLDATAEPELQMLQKSFTFPNAQLAQPQPQRGRTLSQTLLSPTFSDIPSIQVTSHDSSRSQSPSVYQMVRSAPGVFPGMLGEDTALRIQHEYLPTPPLAPVDSSLLDTNMEYYGDFLSPLDQPPPAPRRRLSSASQRANISSMGSVADWSSVVSASTPSDRTKRRHTTCSIPRTTTSPLLSADAGWMLDSPRTTKYLARYFSDVHQRYPFLDRDRINGMQPSSNRDFSPFNDPRSGFSTDNTTAFQRLMAAAIGGMLDQQSRDVSARYVRHAMALQSEPNTCVDMWSSISGLHCAMLLALYCYLEVSEAPFEKENPSDDVSHPDLKPNLWLLNCQIANGCIDLGLHLGTSDRVDDDSRQLRELCRNTFRSAYLLDRNISQLRGRPRAIHDADVDHILIADLQC